MLPVMYGCDSFSCEAEAIGTLASVRMIDMSHGGMF